MEKEIILKDTVGLHAALASKVVQAASKYDVEIRLVYKDKIVDAKSILGLISLAIPSGKNIKIIADGDEAEKAIAEIEKIIG